MKKYKKGVYHWLDFVFFSLIIFLPISLNYILCIIVLNFLFIRSVFSLISPYLILH